MKTQIVSGCCQSAETAIYNKETGVCAECRQHTEFGPEQFNEDEYRPSLAAFRRDVTAEDLLGVTCVVMIVLCAVAIVGGLGL